jgi:CubicO group peptidase (beta-lactamase class C family)
MTRTNMIWEARFAENFAIGYDEKEQPLGHKQRTGVRAAGSMDTTIADYARFMQAVMQGIGLPARLKREMLRPQIPIFSRQQFPTPSVETTEENRAIGLSYGLGWGLFRTPFGHAYFKEGHDDGWENHSVCFADKKTAIIFMANSSNGDSIFKELLEILIKDTYTPWRWEGYTPYDYAKENSGVRHSY